MTLPKIVALFAPEDREKLTAAIRRSHDPAGDGIFETADLRVVHPDGSVRWVTSKGQTFFVGTGTERRLLRTVGAVAEVTDRKQAEMELQRAKAELDRRVEERTRELLATYDSLHHETEERLRAVEELRAHERLLIQQNRPAAMGEMIGNIAHQWRQPLNVLGLLVQELPLAYEVGGFNEQLLKENTGKAMKVIGHMSTTIDDFRNFFQPDKEMVRFRVYDVVATTVSLMAAGFQDRKIAIEIAEDEELQIEGYRNQFSQVVLNLLMNARDAIMARQVEYPEITVHIFRADQRAVVTIADNAGGVPDEIIDRIFEPYFTTKGPDKGTGIGLFMAKTIIEKNMKGSLRVRNTATGAEFTIVV